MKATKYLIVLYVMTLLSCKEEAPKVDYTIISGKIENLKEGTFWLLNYDGYSKYINVKDDGTFLDTLQINKPGAYLIDLGKKRSEIYVENNTKMQFYADAKDFVNTLNFKGDYESLNNHFARKAIALTAFPAQMETLYTLNAEDCKKRLQENYVVPFLKSLENVTHISDSLRTLEKNNINYGYLGKLDMFKGYHSLITKNKDYEAPKWLTDEINDYPKESANDLQYSTAYTSNNSRYYSTETYKVMESDSLSYGDAHAKVISAIKNPEVKNHLVYGRFSGSISRAKNKKETFDKFLAENTSEDYKQRATKLYEEAIRLEPGSPSPKFVNYENYAGGTTSLDDFKGKYVYIDVWATWCGPCKRQIPFLEKVEKQYHGKNIEFVSISVDFNKDNDKWRKMIEEKEMKGIQLITEDAFNSDFISAFNIQAIPRFLLIDPQGNIISASAPLPSDEKLIDLFNEYGI